MGTYRMQGKENEGGGSEEFSFSFFVLLWFRGSVIFFFDHLLNFSASPIAGDVQRCFL